VVLVERNPAVVRHLQALAAELRADEAAVVQADAGKWLATATGAFDVVFLDPPFGSGILPGLLERLGQPGWLAPDGRVYIDCAAGEGPPALPAGWQLLRSGRAGDVGYHLAAVPGPGPRGGGDHSGPQGGRPA
jgi:16S rRNA (guanine966-N2)-methyltransferase